MSALVTEHLPLLTGVPNGIRKLRELILELAMRGRLVPQDEDDEPTSELLKRISKEERVLLDEGVIRKKRSVEDISDKEKPFALPDGWRWVRVAAIGHDWGQKIPVEEFTYIDVGSVDNIAGRIRDPQVLDAIAAPSRARKIVKPGTVIYSTIRPYLLNIAVIDEECSPEPIASTAFAIVHPFCKMPAKYLLQCFRSPIFVKYVESVQTGIAYPAINDSQFFSGLIPLPPLEEQHRIVAKVDELMALCDQMEGRQADAESAHAQLVETLLGSLTQARDANDFAASWQRLSQHFHTVFTTESGIDALKKTVLQLAVMGKLVPQYPSEESAVRFAHRIRTEKQRQLENSTARRQKELEQESLPTWPYEIPVGWEWQRVDDVLHITGGVTLGRKIGNRDLVSKPYLRVANVQRGRLEMGHIKEVEVPDDEVEKYLLQTGDLLITEGGDWDKVGRTAIWRSELPECLHQNHVFRARAVVSEWEPRWAEMYLNSESAKQYFAGSSKQTTNLASINMTQLRSCAFPLPPLAEQRRIIAKVDQLMALCDQLKSRLTQARQLNQQLASTLVEQAVA